MKATSKQISYLCALIRRASSKGSSSAEYLCRLYSTSERLTSVQASKLIHAYRQRISASRNVPASMLVGVSNLPWDLVEQEIFETL